MARWLRGWMLALLALMLAHSCTCSRDTPPAQSTVGERSGFSATMRTHRRGSDAPHLPRVTPIPPSLPTPAEAATPSTVELPADFPQDVPVFENAEAFAVQKMAQDGRTVLFRVDAEPKQIFSFYRDGMLKEGWNVSQEFQGKDQSFLSFKKGKTVTNVTVAKDPRTGKQVIALMYYDEKDLPFPEF